jgi:hypothetical protein
MHGAAAGLVAVVEHRHRVRARILVRPPGHGLAFDVRTQILALEVAQLVMRVEVLSGQAWAALEPDHLHAGFAEFGRENAARRADPNDDDIGLFGCHGSCPPGRGFGLSLQADDRRACEGVPALQIRR